MKITAFVPIKLNSVRLKNKNLLELGNKPLCSYIFDTLLKTNVDKVVAYCSSEKILDYIPNKVKFLKRDSYLDGNNIKGNEIYKKFIKEEPSDYYMLCHTTSPFIKKSSINLAYK